MENEDISSSAVPTLEATASESFSGAIHSTPISHGASNTEAQPVVDISYNLDFNSSHSEKPPQCQTEKDSTPLNSRSDNDSISALTENISWTNDSGDMTGREDSSVVCHINGEEPQRVGDSILLGGDTQVGPASSENQVTIDVVAADDENSNNVAAVDFQKGITCSDVPSALEVLRTRYKLADVSFRRHSLSWSSWNIADMVRGPHRESYYWRTKGGEQRSNDVNSTQTDAERSTCVEPLKSDGLTSDEEIDEICSKIESKDKEIAQILKKILDEDEEKSKDLELLTVKTEPSNTLNRRTNIELNASPKRRENAFQRLMRAIRKRFSSRGRSPNRASKDADKHLNTPDSPTKKDDKSGDRLSLRGSFRQKFINLRRSNSERAQKSTDKSINDVSTNPNETAKEIEVSDKKNSPEKIQCDDNQISADRHAETSAAADILLSLDSSEPVTCGDITIIVPQRLATETAEQEDKQISGYNSVEKCDSCLMVETNFDKTNEDLHAGAELLMKSESVERTEGQPPHNDVILTCESTFSNEAETPAPNTDTELGKDCVIPSESFQFQADFYDHEQEPNLEAVNINIDSEPRGEFLCIEPDHGSLIVQSSSDDKDEDHAVDSADPSHEMLSEHNDEVALDVSCNQTMSQTSSQGQDQENDQSIDLETTTDLSTNSITDMNSGAEVETGAINEPGVGAGVLTNSDNIHDIKTDLVFDPTNDINLNSNTNLQNDMESDIQGEHRNFDDITRNCENLESAADANVKFNHSQETGDIKPSTTDQLLSLHVDDTIGDLNSATAAEGVKSYEDEEQFSTSPQESSVK